MARCWCGLHIFLLSSQAVWHSHRQLLIQAQLRSTLGQFCAFSAQKRCRVTPWWTTGVTRVKLSPLCSIKSEKSLSERWSCLSVCSPFHILDTLCACKEQTAAPAELCLSEGNAHSQSNVSLTRSLIFARSARGVWGHSSFCHTPSSAACRGTERGELLHHPEEGDVWVLGAGSGLSRWAEQQGWPWEIVASTPRAVCHLSTGLPNNLSQSWRTESHWQLLTQSKQTCANMPESWLEMAKFQIWAQTGHQGGQILQVATSQVFSQGAPRMPRAELLNKTLTCWF